MATDAVLDHVGTGANWRPAAGLSQTGSRKMAIGGKATEDPSTVSGAIMAAGDRWYSSGPPALPQSSLVITQNADGSYRITTSGITQNADGSYRITRPSATNADGSVRIQ